MKTKTKKVLVIIAGCTLLGCESVSAQSLKKLNEFEAQQKPIALEEDLIKKPNLDYTVSGYRSPFRAYVEKKEEQVVQTAGTESTATTLPPLTIQGIICGKRLSHAIINNKVLKIGESIDGVKLMDITKSGLTVIYMNRQFFMPSPASLQLKNSGQETKGGKNEG